jgi:hypothetical protein
MTNILKKINEPTYDLKKNIRRRLENDDKEPQNFASWAHSIIWDIDRV